MNCHVQEDWSWVSPSSAKPVSAGEVVDALTDLGAVASPPSPRVEIISIHARSRSESDITDVTEGGSADFHIASAEPACIVDSLGVVVANLLNDPDVGRSVFDALTRDPEFRAMVRRYAPNGAALPAPAQVLTLPAPYPSYSNRNNGGGFSKSVGAAIQGLFNLLGEAFCAFGNALRRLHEDIIIVL